MKTLSSILFSVLLGGTVVDQGNSGVQPWPVNCTNCSSASITFDGGVNLVLDGSIAVTGVDGGPVITISSDRPCKPIFTDAGNANRYFSVGTSVVSMPATAERVSIAITNSARNTGMPGLTCRCDGVAATSAVTSPGATLYPGDTVVCNVPPDAGVNCISDTAATNTVTFECVPQ